MQLTDLSAAAVDRVTRNLSKESWAEAQRFGLSMEDLRGTFLSRVDKPFSLAVLGADGSAVALICMEPISPNRWRTLFASAGSGMEAVWRPLTRFFKEFTDDFVKRTGSVIESFSASGDENLLVARWFLSMGFVRAWERDGMSMFTKGGR
jgi:hypothetical protein